MATKEYEVGKSKHKMYLEAHKFVKQFAKDLKDNAIEDDGMTTPDSILDEYRELLHTKENYWTSELMDKVFDELDDVYQGYYFDFGEE